MPRLRAKSVRKKDRATIATDERERERATVEAIDQDQLAIAQQLHDGVCQSLSGLRLSTAALKRKARPNSLGASDEIARLDELAARSIGDLHELIGALQPVDIDPEDLPLALDELARGMSGAACKFTISGQPSVADDFAAAQIIRITRAAARTAVANGARKIGLKWQGTESECVLLITAETAVFTAASAEVDALFAWKLLERRARAIGGKLQIEGNGASMRLNLPRTTRLVSSPGGAR
jgi:two-component system sensor histidine kinase UhpB